MGCVLCNITTTEVFIQGEKPPVLNPFYCRTKRERKEFLNELAYDIASQHPEMVRRINRYARKIRRAAKVSK